MNSLYQNDIDNLRKAIDDGEFLSSDQERFNLEDKQPQNTSKQEWELFQVRYDRLAQQLEKEQVQNDRYRKQDMYVQQLLLESQKINALIEEDSKTIKNYQTIVTEQEVLIKKLNAEKNDLKEKLKCAQEEIDQKIQKMSASREKKLLEEINDLKANLKQEQENTSVDWDNLIGVVAKIKDDNKRDIGCSVLSEVLAASDMPSEQYMDISKRINRTREKQDDVLNQPQVLNVTIDNSTKNISQLNMESGTQNTVQPKIEA